MPIYFLLSTWVLLSVGREPTPQAYSERGALFYNALTDQPHLLAPTGHPACKRPHQIPETSRADSLRPPPLARVSQYLRSGVNGWLTVTLQLLRKTVVIPKVLEDVRMFAFDGGLFDDYDEPDTIRSLLPIAQPGTVTGDAGQSVELKLLPMPAGN
jgi:hypothetical protein